MHPTDTLLSLSHARIARAAAAGPRKATSPRAQTDRQHLARLAQADPIAVRHATGGDIVIFRASGAVERIKALAVADGDLAYALDSEL